MKTRNAIAFGWYDQIDATDLNIVDQADLPLKVGEHTLMEMGISTARATYYVDIIAKVRKA